MLPYDLTDASLWQLLYSERCRIGRDRQPDLASSLLALSDVITKNGLDTSFGSLSTCLNELCTACLGYEPAGQWHRASFKGTSVFYRLESCGSFVRRHLKLFKEIKHGGWGLGFDLPANAKDVSEAVKEKKFKQLCDKYELTGQNWLPLGKLVNNFQGRREISWWTTDFLEETSLVMPDTFLGNQLTERYKWLVELAYKIGMVNHWVDDQMLLLKIKARHLQPDQVGVPSVIDAFDQPIFDPAIGGKSKRGRAIHIDSDLKPGHTEFVLGAIPVDHIQFIPVRINKDQLKSRYPHAQFDDALAKRLVDWLV